MNKKQIKYICEKGNEYYSSLKTYEERIALSDEYGNHDQPDREFKFYQWICKNKL